MPEIFLPINNDDGHVYNDEPYFSDGQIEEDLSDDEAEISARR